MINLKAKIKPKQGQRKTFDHAFLNRVGRVIRDAIVHEAKREAAMDLKKGTYRPYVEESDQYKLTELVPEGIPRSSRFFNSFKWRIIGEKIEIYSSWPWIRQVIDGRDPYKMTWLTKAAGVETVPFSDPMGKVIFRSTPQNDSDAWVHPGFSKHTFIQKGWERALPTVRKMYAAEAVKRAFG